MITCVLKHSSCLTACLGQAVDPSGALPTGARVAQQAAAQDVLMAKLYAALELQVRVQIRHQACLNKCGPPFCRPRASTVNCTQRPLLCSIDNHPFLVIGSVFLCTVGGHSSHILFTLARTSLLLYSFSPLHPGAPGMRRLGQAFQPRADLGHIH